MPRLNLPRLVLLALAAAALTAPASALADGDPASDTLLGANVFYPYAPPTSGPLERTLNRATALSAKAGAPVRIALIAAPTDLGVIPALFGKPQEYATYLDQEISFQSKTPLLVVMTAGYGVEGLPAAAAAAIARLPHPSASTGDALATAALTAVGRIAAAEGHPLPRAAITPGAGSGGSSNATIVAVLLAAGGLCLLAALVVIWRRRPSR